VDHGFPEAHRCRQGRRSSSRSTGGKRPRLEISRYRDKVLIEEKRGHLWFSTVFKKLMQTWRSYKLLASSAPARAPIKKPENHPINQSRLERKRPPSRQVSLRKTSARVLLPATTCLSRWWVRSWGLRRHSDRWSNRPCRRMDYRAGYENLFQTLHSRTLPSTRTITTSSSIKEKVKWTTTRVRHRPGPHHFFRRAGVIKLLWSAFLYKHVNKRVTARAALLRNMTGKEKRIIKVSFL